MRLNVPFEIRQTGDAGTFTGYANIYAEVDSYGTRFDPGAFTASIERQKERGHMPAMLWSHQHGTLPPGRWDELEDDERGLRGDGSLFMDTQLGREMHVVMKGKGINGLSVGFTTLDYRYETGDDDREVRVITRAHLWEVSPVVFPSNDGARISEVRACLARGEEITARELEAVLRDAGLSKGMARAVVSKGYDGLAGRWDAGGDGDASDEVRKLNDSIRRATQCLTT